jgi:hypothetical protein
LTRRETGGATDGGGSNSSSCLSPKRSLSLTMADSASFSGWKRPWMSQVCASIWKEANLSAEKLGSFLAVRRPRTPGQPA